MAYLQRLALVWAVNLLCLSLAGTPGPSIPIKYCARINTGSTPANISIYNTEGLCHEICFRYHSYALAIVQWQSCWCGDYIPDPSVQVDPSKCNAPCPGYTSDLCGKDGSLFGYLANAAVEPSGTKGGPASPTTPPAPPSAPTSQVVVVITSTQVVQCTAQPTVTCSTSTSWTVETTFSASSSPSTPESPATQPSQGPAVIVSTVTAGGLVTTVTTTPSVSPLSNDNSNLGTANGNQGLGAGAIAGIVIGVSAAIAFLAGLLIWFKYRRRSNDDADEPFESASKRGSTSGMLGTPKMNEIVESRYNGEGSNPSRRRSMLMPVDPRLDFAKGVYARENPSRESVNSLQDNQDYSRPVHEPKKVLRMTNPDPDQ